MNKMLCFLDSMSGIKNRGYAHHILDQGQLTADSELVKELPSLPSHLALQVSLILLDEPSVLQEHSIMPTESAALPTL